MGRKERFHLKPVLRAERGSKCVEVYTRTRLQCLGKRISGSVAAVSDCKDAGSEVDNSW